VGVAVWRKKSFAHGDDLSMRKMISNIVRALLLFSACCSRCAVGIDLRHSACSCAVGSAWASPAEDRGNYISGFVILAERSLRIATW